jgi:hypothetical protein
VRARRVGHAPAEVTTITVALSTFLPFEHVAQTWAQGRGSPGRVTGIVEKRLYQEDPS